MQENFGLCKCFYEFAKRQPIGAQPDLTLVGLGCWFGGFAIHDLREARTIA